MTTKGLPLVGHGGKQLCTPIDTSLVPRLSLACVVIDDLVPIKISRGRVWYAMQFFAVQNVQCEIVWEKKTAM